MAGTYPDVPAPRLAWDRIGARLHSIVPANSQMNGVVFGSANLANANNEADTPTLVPGGLTTAVTANSEIHLELPFAFDLRGFFLALAHRQGGPVTVTHAVEGLVGSTWTSLSTANPFSAVPTNYRTGIVAVSLDDVIRLRWRGSIDFNAQVRGWHLYGYPSTPALQLVEAGVDTPLGGAHFDLGDILAGSTHDRTFRVKNAHGSLTANDITVSASSLTFTMASGITFSDGGAFAATLAIASLAPGAISNVITMRRTVAASGEGGLKAARLLATPLTWS